MPSDARCCTRPRKHHEPQSRGHRQELGYSSARRHVRAVRRACGVVATGEWGEVGQPMSQNAREMTIACVAVATRRIWDVVLGDLRWIIDKFKRKEKAASPALSWDEHQW